MENNSGRNTMIFVLCAVAILIVYQLLVLNPMTKKHQAEQQRRGRGPGRPASGDRRPVRPGRPLGAGFAPVAQAAAASPRVKLDTPSLKGSINLRGARIDDLYLKRYRETIDPKSPMHELFRPEGAEHAWFAEFGWTAAERHRTCPAATPSSGPLPPAPS